MSAFKGRVGIIQRVLPQYRTAFFDLLAEQCQGGLSIFAGSARAKENIPMAINLEKASWTLAHNVHLLDGAFYLCWQRGLKSWLEKWKSDVLIVEANPRYLSTPTATSWMHKRHKPVIGWGLGATQLRGGFADLRTKRRQSFLKQFDALIAYSQRGGAEYRSLGFQAGRVFVAPNAVVARPADKAPQRGEKSAADLAVLYVGRLQDRKRVDALIKVCAALPKAIQPKLHIVGDGPEALHLRRLASEKYPRTEFSGALFGKDLDTQFDQADLFVLPGTGGLAIQQAMAHGLPIIAAEGDGSQEDLVQKENGWLIEPESDADLQNTLAEALANPKHLREMGGKSFERVQTKFNLENMVEAFVSAIKQVAA